MVGFIGQLVLVFTVYKKCSDNITLGHRRKRKRNEVQRSVHGYTRIREKATVHGVASYTEEKWIVEMDCRRINKPGIRARKEAKEWTRLLKPRREDEGERKGWKPGL